ncbi:hypothetical protein L3X38_042004 [Prunus dulcis]|uniref:Uncharacterized protein n=1 Tax=Prunus dulcis TaxID=3755 RepID=A0AAD4UU12_PRUDU|nr:hypothetical protein L3X38_042004 [Prunus dulcis]
MTFSLPAYVTMPMITFQQLFTFPRPKVREPRRQENVRGTILDRWLVMQGSYPIVPHVKKLFTATGRSNRLPRNPSMDSSGIDEIVLQVFLRKFNGSHGHGDSLELRFSAVEVPAAMAQGCHFRKYALLKVACLPLTTLGDSCSEVSMVYSPHRVRKQFRLDQGMPIGLSHSDPFALHRVFRSGGNLPDSGSPLS